MFFFLFRRVRRWLILTVLVPVVGAFARHTAERIERREGGPTKVSKGLHQVGKLGSRTRVGQAIGPAQRPPTDRTP
ncbi:MAG: hypothetical protein ACT4QF_23560 [Sporichthyaceae bacterium]